MQTATATANPDMFQGPPVPAALATIPRADVLPAPAPVPPKPSGDPYTASPEIGDLISALAAAQFAFAAIEKDERADVESRREGARSYSYRYASLASVLNAVRPALAENGVALMQFPQNGQNTVAVTTLLAHKGGQFIKSELRLAYQTGSDPQALGSAITYLRRYAVQSILGVAPEEDDDGRAAGGGSSFKSDSRVPSPAREVAMPERQSTQPGAAAPAAAAPAFVTLARMQVKQLPARPGVPACSVWVYELSDRRQFATKDALTVDKLEAWRACNEPIGKLTIFEAKSGWQWLENIASAKSGEMLTPARS